MQHHGLPTRLLDWTYSPFVVLHFITDRSDRFDTDGVILCIDCKSTHHWLPERLKERLAIETTDVFTAEMLEQDAATLHEFDSLDAEPLVAFFEPPSLGERIVNQFALSSLLSDPRLPLDHWLMQRPDIAQRLIIPALLK